MAGPVLGQILLQDLDANLGRRQAHRPNGPLLAAAAKRLQLGLAFDPLFGVLGGQLGQRLGDTRRPRLRINQLLGQLIAAAVRP